MTVAVVQESVTIGSRSFAYQRPWDGRRLRLAPACPYLGFDTETEVVDLTVAVPRLALASFSTGRQHGLIHPDQVGEFVRLHEDARFVCHNAALRFLGRGPSPPRPRGGRSPSESGGTSAARIACTARCSWTC